MEHSSAILCKNATVTKGICPFFSTKAR